MDVMEPRRKTQQTMTAPPTTHPVRAQCPRIQLPLRLLSSDGSSKGVVQQQVQLPPQKAAPSGQEGALIAAAALAVAAAALAAAAAALAAAAAALAAALAVPLLLVFAPVPVPLAALALSAAPSSAVRSLRSGVRPSKASRQHQEVGTPRWLLVVQSVTLPEAGCCLVLASFQCQALLGTPACCSSFLHA